MKRIPLIRDQPGIQISGREYKDLPADKYGFEWMPLYDPRGEFYGYKKGKSLEQLKFELEEERRIHREKVASGEIIEWDDIIRQNNIKEGDRRVPVEVHGKVYYINFDNFLSYMVFDSLENDGIGHLVYRAS